MRFSPSICRSLAAIACAVVLALLVPDVAAQQWVYGQPMSNTATNSSSSFVKNSGTVGLQHRFIEGLPVASLIAAVTCPTFGWVFINNYVNYGPNNTSWHLLSGNVVNGTCWRTRGRTPGSGVQFLAQMNADS